MAHPTAYKKRRLEILNGDNSSSEQQAWGRSDLKNEELIDLGHEGSGMDFELGLFRNIQASILLPPFTGGFELRETLLTDVYGPSCDYNNQLDFCHRFMAEHIESIHSPVNSGWDMIFSSGNTHSMNLVVEEYCEEGDYILVEEFTFPEYKTVVELNSDKGLKSIGVPIDAEGLVPAELQKILEDFESEHDINKLKILYIIPTGQNPTGVTLCLERKRQIYVLAQKYDFLILEDDPYFYFQMNKYQTMNERSFFPDVPSDHDYATGLIKSFLSIDTDGRVICLDSFSKSICPGFKMGTISCGNTKIVKRLANILESRDNRPCPFSVMMLCSLFRIWGHEGFLNWLNGLRQEYASKRDMVIDSIYECFQSHLDNDIVKLTVPDSGMFFIIHLNLQKHPLYRQMQLEIESSMNDETQKQQQLKEYKDRIEQMIFQKSLINRVVLLPGSYFEMPRSHYLAADRSYDHLIFFRGSFVSCSLDELFVGIERFHSVIKNEFQKN